MTDGLDPELLKKLLENPLPPTYNIDDALLTMRHSWVVLKNLMAAAGVPGIPSMAELEKWPPRDYVNFMLGNAVGHYRASGIVVTTLLARDIEPRDFARAEELYVQQLQKRKPGV